MRQNFVRRMTQVGSPGARMSHEVAHRHPGSAKVIGDGLTADEARRETPRTMRPITRRDFLRTTAAAGLAAALPPTALSSEDILGGRGFCLATYGFRNFTGPQAVEMTKSMGVTLMDLWPKLASSLGGGKKDNKIKAYHENPELWAEMKEALERHGVRAVVYGVQRFTSNHEENRKIFAWAKQNGIETFGAAPDPDAFDSLEKLVEEFGINIAIHNHGPGDKHYAKIDQLVAALKGRHPRIGSCADVGHFWRIQEDPVQALETLGTRILGVHLKDQISVEEQAVVGEGKMDIPGILKALKKIGYRGPLTLEYESNPEDPVPGMKQSLENIRKMLA